MIAMSTTAITAEALTDGGDGSTGSSKQLQQDPKNSTNVAKINRYSSPSALQVVAPKDNSTKNVNITAAAAVVVEDVMMMKADTMAAASSASLATAAAAAACVNHSVVPDLMRVYESMTQTSGSTPSKSNPNYNNATTTTMDDLNATMNAQQQQPPYADYLGHQQLNSASTLLQQQQQFYDPSNPTNTGAGYNTNMYFNPGTTTTTAAQQSLWGNYDTSGISLTIPPPYAFPSQQVAQQQQQQSYGGTTSVNDNNNNNNNSDNIMEHNNTSTTTGGGGGRPVRTKRTVSMAGMDNNEQGVGYESSADGNSSGRDPPNKSRRKSNKGRNSNTTRSSATGGGGGGGGNTTGGDGKNQKPDSDDKNDGRWSKRFTWPDDLHRDFVSAIFDVGLKHSSPSTVMEHMPPHEQITTERIKSHLQKYRLHRQKAKKEFMTSYQQTMEQIATDGGITNLTSLAGGQVAAHLSYVSEHHPDPDPETTVDGTDAGTTTGMVVTNEEAKFQEDLSKSNQLTQPAPPEEPSQDVFYLPKLTENEKVSPIGLSLGYLMGLFFTLKQQLDIQRHEQLAMGQELVQQDVQQQQLQLLDEFASEQEGGRKMTPLQNPLTLQSSSRSNLEVNSLIKREMQSQMAFQNKMRALKQQELNKYSKASMDDNNNSTSIAMNSVIAGSDGVREHHDGLTNDTRQLITVDPQQQHLRGGNKKQPQQEYQGAGEAGGADTVVGKEQSVSLGGEEDDFWNTSVVDDELFDFLMNS